MLNKFLDPKFVEVSKDKDVFLSPSLKGVAEARDKFLSPSLVSVTPEPEAQEARAEGIYASTAFSPWGIWTPDFAKQLGMQGLMPQPPGGWDELGRPLDELGNPYQSYTDTTGAKKTIADRLKGIAKGIGEEALAASELAMSIASGILLYFPSKLYGTMALPFGREVADIAEEEMAKLGYQPLTEKGEAAAELVGKGFELFLTPARMADEELSKLSPEAGYLLGFGGELAEFILTGGIVRGAKAKFRPTVEQGERIVNAKRKLETDTLKAKEEAVNRIPDERIKATQQKILETEKIQAELESVKIQEKLDYGQMIKEDLGDIGSRIKGIKELPRKKLVDEQIDKALKAKEPKVKEPKVEPEPVTEADLQTGTPEPVELSTHNSPFRTTAKKTRQMKRVYSKLNEKQIAEEPDLFLGKFINDVNRWLEGDKAVDINVTRNALSEIASRGEELRYRFAEAEDPVASFESFKDLSSEAAIWARRADRLIDKPSVDLNMMIPLDQMPKQVLEVGRSIKGFMSDRGILAKNIFRNKELFDKTGFWFGKDFRWRYELDDSKASFKSTDISLSESYSKAGVWTGYLDAVLDYPELYKVFPKLKDILLSVDKRIKSEGVYFSREKIIKIRTPDKPTLLHELQHTVNDLTGSKFVGTSPGYEAAKGGTRGSMSRYLRDPGEMEARLVERRRGMTQDMRKTIPPWESLDVMLTMERLGPERGPKLYSGIPLDKIASTIVDTFKSGKPTEIADRLISLYGFDFSEKLITQARKLGVPLKSLSIDQVSEMIGKLKLEPTDLALRKLEKEVGADALEILRDYDWDIPKVMKEVGKVKRGIEARKRRDEFKLYSGVPIDRLKNLLKFTKKGIFQIDTSKLTPQQKPTVRAANEFHKAFEEARAAKDFDMKVFLDRAGFHTYRAVHEKVGLLRNSLIKNYGEVGQRIVHRVDAEANSQGHGQRMHQEMMSEAFRDVPFKLSSAVDAVNLAQRLKDIYGYKTIKEFKPPKGMNPTQTTAYRELMEIYHKLTPEELAKAEKASGIMFDHLRSWVDEMVEWGLKSKEEGEALKAHNYRKMRSVTVEKLYDQKYEVRVGDKLVRQTDSGVDPLGREAIKLIETDAGILYGEVANRIARRIDNQRTKLEWVGFDKKHPDNPHVIVKHNDKVLERGARKVPDGWVRDYWYDEGEMKTMHFHPDVALQLMSRSNHMSYQLTRALTTILGVNLVRSLAVGTSAAWAVTRGLTMDIGHTFFSSRVFDEAQWKRSGGKRPWKRLYSPTPKYLGQIGRDMADVFYDVMTRGEKTGTYEKNGGMLPFLAMREQSIMGRGIKPPGYWSKALDGLSYVSKSMEMWNRVAVMHRRIRNRAIEEGISLEKAYKDKDITFEATQVAVERLPYGQGGWLLKAVDKIFGPFISASYNAGKTFVRSAKENPVDFAARVSNVAIPTVGATIAALLYAPEAVRDTPSYEYASGAVVPFFPGSLHIIDENGDKRTINMKLPLDPNLATVYNIFRGLTHKMLYEADLTDIEPDYDAIVKSLTRSLPMDAPLSPTLSAWVTYFTNTDVWRERKVSPEALSWPLSEAEGKFDPDVSQVARDIGETTKLSPRRLEAAGRQMLPQSNEFVWIIGNLYDSLFSDIDPELRRQHWLVALSRAPGIRNIMSLTRPMGSRGPDRDRLEDKELFDRALRNGELDLKAEGFYWKNVGKESDIDKFIDEFDEKHIRDALGRRRKFTEKTTDLPHRSGWKRMFHTSPENKARDYFKIWKSYRPDERSVIEEELVDLMKAGYIGEGSRDRFYGVLEDLRDKYYDERSE